MQKSNLIISEGNRPLWQRILAALFYTLSIMLLYAFFMNVELSFATKNVKGGLGLIEAAIFVFGLALSFSVIKDVFFNIDTKQYKIQYSAGPFKVGKWKPLPNIEYVSVFKQPLKDGDHIYEVNLWYNRNKHFEVYENPNQDAVFELGKHVAKSLDVKLLDATKPNAHRWVDLQK